MISVLVIGFAVVAFAFALLAVARPPVALLSLVALDVSNLNAVLADHLGFSPYKPQLALAVLVLVVLAVRRRLRFAWSPVLLGLIVLFAGFALTLIHTADPVTSQQVLEERARDLFYAVVVLGLLYSTNHFRQTVIAVVSVLAGLAALTAVHEFLLNNSGDLGGLSRVPLVQEGGASTPRHAGTVSDVNFWARLLIVFTPLALSLVAAEKGLRTRLFFLACVFSLFLGVYLTQSRGGFIALLAAVILWLVLAGGRYRRSLFVLPVLLLVIVPLSGIGSRLMTLGALSSTSVAAADPSVETRKRLQMDALRMFVDAPVFGQGIGTYGTIFPAYDRLSNQYQPVDIVVASHNFYLEQAADGGLLLLAAWAFFLGTIAFAALRAAGLAARVGANDLRFWSIGVLAGLTGWAISSVFLHLSDFRALLLLAVLAAVVDRKARTASAALPSGWTPPPDTGEPDGLVPPRSWVPAVLALVAALCLIGSGIGLAATPARYAASVTLEIAPVSDTLDGGSAYQQDVITRGLVTPTLATVINRAVTSSEVTTAASATPEDLTTFQARSSRLGGAITVEVVGRTPEQAAALAAAAADLSRQAVADLQTGYRLQTFSDGSAATVTRRGLSLWLIALGALAGVTLCAAAPAALRRRSAICV